MGGCRRAWLVGVAWFGAVPAAASELASEAPVPPAAAAPPPSATPAPEPVVAPAPPERRRPEVSTVFSDDLEVRYWSVPDRLPGFPDRRVLDYVEAVNRFTGSVRSGRWSFFGQLDAVVLGATSYFLDDVRRPERDLLAPGAWSPLVPGAFDPTTHGMSGWNLASRNAYVNLEKVRLSYDAPGLTVQVGDTYAAFGRGIALDADRNVDIDLDTSIQGVKVLWRPGDWDITAVLGQLNRQQVFQDNPNLGLFGDRRHTVGGLRLQRYGLGPVHLGAHGVVYDFTTDEGWVAGFEELATPPDVVVGGGTVEAVGLGPTDWFLEVDGFAFPTDDTFGGEERHPGLSAYLSGAIYAGPTTWLVEAKRSVNAERVNALLAPELYEVSTGPTLEYERQITEDSAATMNSNDLWGTRVRVDWSAIPGVLVPYTSVSVFRDLDRGALHFNTVPETVVHGLVGVEWTQDAWAVLANVGYRHDDRDGDTHGADRHLHGDVLAKVPLGKGFAFDISVASEWYRWGDNPVQQADYVEAETSLALRIQDRVTLVWYTDYSTNPLIDSEGNLTDAVYGAGEVQVKALDNLTLRAFYGAYKSGIRCSGGQCRVLPGFEGARLSLSAQF